MPGRFCQSVCVSLLAMLVLIKRNVHPGLQILHPCHQCKYDLQCYYLELSHDHGCVTPIISPESHSSLVPGDETKSHSWSQLQPSVLTPCTKKRLESACSSAY